MSENKSKAGNEMQSESGAKTSGRDNLPDYVRDSLNQYDKDAIPDWIVEHLRAYEKSPKTAYLWDATPAGGYANTPTLLLTTIGRKSGRRITVPLLYGQDGDDRYIIVGSKGGEPIHPSWYLNLVANPEVEVQAVERKFRTLARTARGEERHRLWRLMTEVYPPYPNYQKRTEREIPVVVLEAPK